MLNIVDIQIDYREGNIRIRTEPEGYLNCCSPIHTIFRLLKNVHYTHGKY